MGNPMTYRNQIERVLNDLSKIHHDDLGTAAAQIEFWFQEHNIDLVLLPPVTEKPKPPTKKTPSVKKRKDKQISMF